MADHPSVLDELDAAKANLKAVVDRQDNYSGNNPNKYQSAVRIAQENVARLTAAAKRSGLIASTDEERMATVLDGLHPSTRHGDKVEHDGRFYRRSILPHTKTRSGRVATWTKTWHEIADRSHPSSMEDER